MPEINETLEEVKAKYILEPDLKDIYVESTLDKSILKWFFDSLNNKNVKVFCIDLVEMPSKILEKYRLRSNSNQSKIIALSEELCSISNNKNIMTKCIADVDFDRHLGLLRKNRVLKYTDYTSIEMYFLNKNHIKKFFCLVLNSEITMESKLMKDILSILKDLFIYRLANIILKLQLAWPSKIEKYVNIQRNEVIFNSSKFLETYLLPKNKYKNVFVQKVKEIASSLDRDIRNNIRGHDFTNLLYKVSHNVRGMSPIKCYEDFNKALVGSLEISFIESEPLFVDLKSWSNAKKA
jgi:hypothetical protein